MRPLPQALPHHPAPELQHLRVPIRPHTADSDWDAGQFCNGTEEGVIFVFRWAGATDRLDLYPRQIDDGSVYELRDEASGKEDTYTGAELVELGLTVELAPGSAKLLSYRAD